MTTHKCSECNWTNVGLINLGDPDNPRYICQGCVKRMIERMEKVLHLTPDECLAGGFCRGLAFRTKSWVEYCAIRNAAPPSIEQMRNALLANGWTPSLPSAPLMGSGVWKSPTGQRFLGPVQAYKIMCGVFASDHCNVCGCALQGDSEHALGMCTAHANFAPGQTL